MAFLQAESLDYPPEGQIQHLPQPTSGHKVQLHSTRDPCPPQPGLPGPRPPTWTSRAVRAPHLLRRRLSAPFSCPRTECSQCPSGEGPKSRRWIDHEPGSAHCVRPVIMSICLTVICGCFVTNNVTVSPLHINNFMKNNFSGPTVGLLSSSWRLRVAQSLRCIILSGSFHKLCHPLVSSVDSVVACMSWDTDVFALRETKLSDWNTIRFISLKYNFKK